MPTYKKLESGRWQAQVRLKGQKLHSATFRTKTDAKTWAEELENRLKTGRYIDTTKLSSIHLVDVLTDYLASITPQKATSSYKKEASKIKLLTQSFGHLSVDALTPAKVQAFVNQRKAEGLKPATINRDLVTLNQAMETYLALRGLSLPGPSPVTVVRRTLKPTNALKVMDSRDRRLEPGEEEALRRAFWANPVMREVLTILLETALRREELCNAKRSDVRGNVLEVPWHKTKSSTRKSRFVPLSSVALAAIGRLPVREDGLLVGIRPDSMTQTFARACARAGIKDLRLHDIRHEATSRLVESGKLSLPEVQAITGHADLRSFSRYTNLRPEEIAEKLG